MVRNESPHLIISVPMARDRFREERDSEERVSEERDSEIVRNNVCSCISVVLLRDL